MCKKTLMIIIGFVILLNVVYSTTIDEKNLHEMSYQNIVVEKNEDVCFKIDVPSLQSSFDSTFVFVIDIENYIPVTSDVKIDVYLNEYLEKSIEGKDIKKRNVVKMYNHNQDNKLKLCVKNDFLPRLIISKESKVGFYLLAEIVKDNFYVIAPHSIKTNTLVPIEVVFRNTGSNDAFVKVENAMDKYMVNNLLNHISGEYEYEGVLRAGEEKKIKYFIKTKEDLLYVTPRAKLTYVDEFGETKEILTDPVIVNAEEKEYLLDVFVIDVPNEVVPKTTYTGKIILRNNSDFDVSNLFVDVLSNESVEMLDKIKTSIKKKEVVEIPFRLKVYNNKDVEVLFNVSYNSEDIDYLQSEKTTFDIKDQKNSLYELIGVFVLVFVVIYIWFLKI